MKLTIIIMTTTNERTFTYLFEDQFTFSQQPCPLSSLSSLIVTKYGGDNSPPNLMPQVQRTEGH